MLGLPWQSSGLSAFTAVVPGMTPCQGMKILHVARCTQKKKNLNVHLMRLTGLSCWVKCQLRGCEGIYSI